MSRRRKILLGGAAAVLVISTIGAYVVTASPARAYTEHHWYLNPGRFSPVLRGVGAGGGTCDYRIRWGNFGGTAFTQIRVYRGRCGDSSRNSGDGYRPIIRWKTSATSTHEQIGAVVNASRGGRDGCGGYFEAQVNSTGSGIAYDAGIVVNLFRGSVVFYRYFPTSRGGSITAIPSSVTVRHCDGS